MTPETTERHGFVLRYMNGMAVLIVPPESERSRSVYADDVAGRMKILGIPDISAKKLRAVIEAGSGRPEALVEWPAGAALGASIAVTVSEDGMLAVARVQAPKPGGAPLSGSMVKEAVKNAGVAKGLDQESLRTLLIGAGTERPVTIARGKEPVEGSPAKTECLFVTDRGKPWKEMGGGRINLKELNFIQNRKAGDLVARRIEAVPPEDGYDVFGTVLRTEIPEDEPPLKAGPGVRPNEVGLIAEIDGNVLLEDGEVCVEPSVTVKTVDYSTGNIDFDGSVVVEGTVADGFSVKAAGDIQIGKTVGRASLESGRNLVLVAGMVGDNDGICRVSANLYAKFLEGARTEVAGDVIVTEAVLHSETETDGCLFLTEGRGEVTGGVTVAAGGVDCRRIGNVYAGETRIYVGSSPNELKEFNELAALLKVIRDETDDLDRQIDYLKSQSGVDPREISDREKSKDTRLAKLKEGAVRIKEMRRELTAADGTVIVARDRIYPGAGLYFGLEEYPLGDKGMERVVLRQERGRIAMHGYVEGQDFLEN